MGYFHQTVAVYCNHNVYHAYHMRAGFAAWFTDGKQYGYFPSDRVELQREVGPLL